MERQQHAVKAAAQRSVSGAAHTRPGYFKAILPGYIADAQDHAEREAEAQAVEERRRIEEADAEATRERAERALWESTEAERNKILATMPDYVPARVRPLAGGRFQTWFPGPGSSSVSVWRHPEFDVVFAGNRSKLPGPDWIAGYMRRSD